MLDRTEASSTPTSERIVGIFEPAPDGDSARYEAELTIPGRCTGHSTPVSTTQAPSTTSLRGTKTHHEQEPIAQRAHSSADSLAPANAEEGGVVIIKGRVNSMGPDEDLSTKGDDPPMHLEPNVSIVKTTSPKHDAGYSQGHQDCRADRQPGYLSVEYNSARVEPTIVGTIHELPALGNRNSYRRIGRHGGIDLTASARARCRNFRYDAASLPPIAEPDRREEVKDRDILMSGVIAMFALAGLVLGGGLLAFSMELRTRPSRAQLDGQSNLPISATTLIDTSSIKSLNPKEVTTEPTTYKLSSTVVMPLSSQEANIYLGVGTSVIIVSLCFIIFAICRVRARIVALTAEVCPRKDNAAVIELLV